MLPAEDGAIGKKRKDDAMYALLKETSNLNYRPANDEYSYQSDKQWYLAEAKKYGTVRMIKDKETNDWVTTTYGTINGKTDYYGLDVNTGKMIAPEKAMELYHKSHA